MKINVDFKFNNQEYPKGSDVPWYMIYPFFMVHIFIIGGTIFLAAYYSQSSYHHMLMFLGGGFFLYVYIQFYNGIFGVEAIKWMFINSILGLVAVWNELSWVLSFALDKEVDDFPIYVHIMPTLYYIIYTFLIRQAILDLTNSRENNKKKFFMETAYVVISLLIYTLPQSLI